MRRVELIHLGHNEAAGFLIDPELLGEQEARRRVLSLWEPDCALYRLPDDRWCMTIPNAVETSDVTAPGLIAVATEGGLSSGPMSSSEERPVSHGGLSVAGWHNGDSFHYQLASTDRIDPASWIEVTGPVTHLRPVVAPAMVAPIAEAQPAPPLDMRAAARVGDRTESSTRFIQELQAQASAAGKPSMRTSGGTGGTQRQRPKRDSLLAKLVLRTPMRHEIGRKHAKYLKKLTEQFNNGNFEEALRDAIAVGGAGGALSLRLPGRRKNLDISTSGSQGGRSVPFGATVSHHLTEVYRRAATELESQQRIHEAAFVLAELLNSATEAVSLYERHNDFRAAATLASNRKLDAALAARLWWRAGDRDRAILISRTSGNFAAVMKRIEDTDPESARDFRLAWVDHLERSGNVLGAVEIGWADPSMRSLLHNVIRRGISHGGDAAVPLSAYRFALSPSVRNRTDIESMLEQIRGDNPAIRLFAEAVANVEIVDKVADRELCTLTARAVLPSQQQSDKPFVVAYRKVRNRADPVLRADTPAQPWGRPSAGDIVEVAPVPSGTIPIADAAQITEDLVLVALGELGTRLMRADGRVVVHWDTPAHDLVVADHGGSALLVAKRGPTIDVHHLDLTSRKMRRYGTLESSVWARSFDGASWAAFDKRGLGFYDVLAVSPTTMWRELDGSSTWHAVARSSTELTAIVDTQQGLGQLQLWKWELPSMRLLAKPSFPHPETAHDVQLLANGSTIWEFDDERPTVVISIDQLAPTPLADAENAREILADGLLLGRRTQDGEIVIQQGTAGQTIARLHSDAELWRLRSSPSFCTVSDNAGRIFGISRRTPRPPLVLRVVS